MDYGYRSPFDRLRSVLMYRPDVEQDVVIDPDRWGYLAKPNLPKMQEEFDAYVDILKSEGVEPVFIETNEIPTPNLFCTRDLGICTPAGIIVGNPKEEYRQGEELNLIIAAEKLGIPIAAEIKRGFFEGGDFVRIADDIAALGLRMSDEYAYDQLEELIEGELLPIKHSMLNTHLDVLFNMLTPKLAIAYVSALPADLLRLLKDLHVDMVEISKTEEKWMATNFVRLESGKIICTDKNQNVIKALEERGVDVISIHMPELMKANCGPRAMTMTIRRK